MDCESLLILLARCTFEENIVVTVLAKLVPLFFQKCTCAFLFRTRSLTDRSQIVTDTCKNYVSNFVGSLLNHLYHYANENVSMKHLSLICITSILTTIYSLKKCSVYGGSCLNYNCKSLGSFGKNFVKFIGKNENVIQQARSVRIGKYEVLSALLKTSDTVFPTRTSWLANIYMYFK